MMNHESEERVRGAEGMHALAARVAAGLRQGAVVALHGDLGAGKTTFVQGLGVALNVEEPVTSPTFALIHEYHGRLRVFHVDLYRLGGEEEAESIGLEDCFASDGVTVIEWAERAPGLLPPETLHIDILPGANADERSVRLRGGAPV